MWIKLKDRGAWVCLGEPVETSQGRQSFRWHKTQKPLLGRQTRGGHPRQREQHLQRPGGWAGCAGEATVWESRVGLRPRARLCSLQWGAFDPFLNHEAPHLLFCSWYINGTLRTTCEDPTLRSTGQKLTWMTLRGVMLGERSPGPKSHSIWLSCIKFKNGQNRSMLWRIMVITGRYRSSWRGSWGRW